MTTPWQPTPEWQGTTVAVLASGPSLTPRAADALREHRTIAVNFALRQAPWADMLVALDGNWGDEMRRFEGMRVTGVEDPENDALYCGPRWEQVQLAPGNVIEIHNSGLAAIRIAAAMGARRIILAGFDWPASAAHFYDEGDDLPYTGLAEGIVAIAAELQARGVSVERYQPESHGV